MIDYIVVNNKYRSSVKDVKGEEIGSQHCLLLMDTVVKKEVWRKVKFRKKFKLWRVRELEVEEEFAEGVNNKCDGNEEWCGLKRNLLDVASEVCGYTVVMWLCVEKESYLGFGMGDIGRNIVRQKKHAKRDGGEG